MCNSWCWRIWKTGWIAPSSVGFVSFRGPTINWHTLSAIKRAISRNHNVIWSLHAIITSFEANKIERNKSVERNSVRPLERLSRSIVLTSCGVALCVCVCACLLPIQNEFTGHGQLSTYMFACLYQYLSNLHTSVLHFVFFSLIEMAIDSDVPVISFPHNSLAMNFDVAHVNSNEGISIDRFHCWCNVLHPRNRFSRNVPPCIIALHSDERALSTVDSWYAVHLCWCAFKAIQCMQTKTLRRCMGENRMIRFVWSLNFSYAGSSNSKRKSEWQTALYEYTHCVWDTSSLLQSSFHSWIWFAHVWGGSIASLSITSLQSEISWHPILRQYFWVSPETQHTPTSRNISIKTRWTINKQSIFKIVPRKKRITQNDSFAFE